MALLGAEALQGWLESPTPPVVQPDEGITYASKIDKAEARIDWTRSAEDVARQVRALSPTPGAWFEVHGERIKLLAAETANASGRLGEVIDDRLTIATASGSIRPVQVQRAGKGAMNVGDLLRGFAVPKGTILT
jgi:methionyl-tRNA formyltransferase